jgi:Na+-translocating ferredoxin:NAD+ oxidoreductase subunit B
MTEIDVYSDLAGKLGAPISKRFLTLLEAIFTPEEAGICMQLFYPTSCQELAGKLGMDENKLSKILDSLIDRGLITRGKTLFAFHTTLLGLHHDMSDTGVLTGPHAISQKIKDLWGDFFYNEWSDIWVNMAIERKKAGKIGNILTPAIGALELSPNIKPEQILPSENWKLQIQNAKRRIVAPCGCRTLWGKCDHPHMTCFACFDNSRGIYYLNKPGRLLKEISMEETLKIVRQNEEIGLIHWGVCYCCQDACEMMYSYTKRNRTDLVGLNRFLAAVEVDTCIGCQDCVDKCMFNAIEMKKPVGSKKLKASIDKEKCRGCGVCVVGCKQKALRLEIVRPPEYITSLPPLVWPSPPPPPSEPGKAPRKVFVGAYGGFYDLD